MSVALPITQAPTKGATLSSALRGRVVGRFIFISGKLKEKEKMQNCTGAIAIAEFFEDSARIFFKLGLFESAEEDLRKAQEARNWDRENPNTIYSVPKRMAVHFGINYSLWPDMAAFLMQHKDKPKIDAFWETAQYNPYWAKLWVSYGATPEIVSAALIHSDESLREAALKTGLATPEQVATALSDKNDSVVEAAIATGLVTAQQRQLLLNHPSMGVRLSAMETGMISTEEFVSSLIDKGYVFMRERH